MCRPASGPVVEEGVIVVDNQTQNVAAPTAAPMIDAYPAVGFSRRLDAFDGRLVIMPTVGVTAHAATGQVSVANANANIVFTKAWAPPPRRVSL